MGNTYIGTKNGTVAQFTDDTLGDADPGSIMGANVNGAFTGGLASTATNPTGYFGDYKSYMGQDVLGGLTTKGGLQDISTGMGIFGAGYNIYDSAFGKTAKLNDKKMELMDQQIASNKQNMANKDTFNTTWAGASNGLAAKYATPRVG